jgi:hypothetical protein
MRVAAKMASMFTAIKHVGPGEPVLIIFAKTIVVEEP